MLYQPLILDNSNWEKFRPKLSSYPLRVSKLNGIDSRINVKSISLKYVWSGLENYSLGNKLYGLNSNQFLIANKFNDCHVTINEKNNCTGICIDIDENYFSDVLYSIYYPNDIDSLNSNLSFFLTDDCFTQGWHADGNLQTMLNTLKNYVSLNKPLLFKDDFLRNITTELICNQEKIIHQYNRLSGMKSTTRKELFERLLRAKKIMSEPGIHSMTIKEIAHSVSLSEFRFHHLFKKTFGTTPLRFKTIETLKHAIQLHREQKLTWTDISEQLDFPDVQTFSKVFKRVFGYSPNKIG